MLILVEEEGLADSTVFGEDLRKAIFYHLFVESLFTFCGIPRDQ